MQGKKEVVYGVVVESPGMCAWHPICHPIRELDLDEREKPEETGIESKVGVSAK